MTGPRARSLFIAALGIAPMVLTTAIADASERRTNFPCAGCLTDLPAPIDAQKKVPLLVLLHGDGQAPLAVAPLFAKEAAARGIVLFVPRCPKADGCTDGRWWAWGKDPSWFDAQIAAIDAVQPLDHERLWLAGWSGGGSYIGSVAPALFGRFAAVNVNGGGMAPSAQACPQTSCKLPIYFLVGDKNPLHALAKDLRAWFDGCGQEVVWDLLPGKDHGGELVEISKPARVKGIVEWMESHPRSCLAAAGAGTGTGTGAESEPVTETETETETETGTESESETETGIEGGSPIPATRLGRCGCGVARGRETEVVLAAIAWLGVVVLRRRLRGARRA